MRLPTMWRNIVATGFFAGTEDDYPIMTVSLVVVGSGPWAQRHMATIEKTPNLRLGGVVSESLVGEMRVLAHGIKVSSVDAPCILYCTHSPHQQQMPAHTLLHNFPFIQVPDISLRPWCACWGEKRKVVAEQPKESVCCDV